MATIADPLAGTLNTGQSTERENGPGGHGSSLSSTASGPGCSDVDGPGTARVHASDCPPDGGGGATGCAHVWEYGGASPLPHPRCDHPQRIVCSLCSAQRGKRCRATRESRCAPCAHSHRLLLKQVIVSGAVEARQVGQFFFVTITAPGADVLPWDAGACSHAPEVPCSGKLGCKVDGFDGAVWNGTAPRRWSWFVTYLRRRLGHLEFVGVWEDQERGVLHRHFLMRLDRPTTERRANAAVRNCARRWGFGSQYDVRAITGEAAREAWYIASYATKTVDRVGDRKILNPRTGELRQGAVGFRAWSASRHWGDTCKRVRERQRAWAAASASADPAGRSPALDPNEEFSTRVESEVCDLLRAELGAVLL